MLFYVAHGCPNCNGKISDELLSLGLPCKNCLDFSNYKEKGLKDLSLKEVVELLKKSKALQNLKKFEKVEREVQVFEKTFKNLLGVSPSSLQINWAKRLYLGESFAIISPTGTGKTTFGLISSLLNSKKSLIIVPTKVLVQHLYERISQLKEKALEDTIKNHKILAYQGSTQEKRLLEAKNFDIFICTQAFFHKNFELLTKIDFSLIFVDDVDSFLKNGKNVENLFYLLGFTKEEVTLALKREKEEEDFEELLRIKEKHLKKYRNLIISSATLKPKTNRILLFQNLLGFEITRFVSSLRKVEDCYLEMEKRDWENLLEKTYEICKDLKGGGLLFVEESWGREGVGLATEYLRSKGLKVFSYLEKKEEELLDLLKNREIDLAIGLAHLSNPLLRGIDLPLALHYVIFLGIPKHRFSIGLTEENPELSLAPLFLHNLLLNLLVLFEQEDRLKAFSYLSYLKKYLTLKEEQLSQYESLYRKVKEIRNFLLEKLTDKTFLERLKTSDEVFLEIGENGKYYLVVGNAQVYLQGSGRVSRLSAQGLLPGLSLLLVDNPKAFLSLKKRLRFYMGEEANFRKVSSLEELLEINQRILEERKNLPGSQIDFRNYLIIVESPHKAKTIANFFGKPSKRSLNRVILYEIPIEGTLLSVCASLGHILNLSRKEGIFGVSSEDGHFYPIFDTIKMDKETGEQLVDEVTEFKESLIDKGEIIQDLRSLAYCSNEVFIASDPDAEGEKIAYDLFINLRPFQKNIKRMEIHEITVNAFKKALKNATSFNLARVKAQLARRVADRWVGFTLSKALWDTFQKKYLSAGRVQTPVLGWVIKRAEEAKEQKYIINFKLGSYPFSLEFENKELAQRVYEELPNLSWKLLEKTEENLSPPPPYTTDTILEEAYYYFRFSTSYCMSLLQELFELGLITYHRTDSTRVSEVGSYQIAKTYLEQTFGAEYFYPREWSKEGAHEAIRPTHPWDVKELKLRAAHGLITFKKIKDSLNLYDLIFRRFISSQCKPIRLLKGTLSFYLPSYTWQETVNLEILESGFDILWTKPKLFSLSEKLKPQDLEFKSVPKVYLYNQGSLIQEMKKRGLGRPSTYAEIVSTLLKRYYIYELKNGSLVPTNLGKEVYSYLVEHFKEYVSEDFTRELEEFMDGVERGEWDWEEICHKLKKLIENAFL